MKNIIALFICCISFPIFGQNENANPIPQWQLDNWAAMTEGNGVWIADNSEYKNENEPFDEYGIKWKYGIGEKHLKGRMFCIKDGEEIVSAWEFMEFWDPEKGEARLIQIGGDGTLGQGKLWPIEDGKTKEQMKYTSPNGASFETGHIMWMDDDRHHTKSFEITNGEWVERRYYIWKRKK